MDKLLGLRLRAYGPGVQNFLNGFWDVGKLEIYIKESKFYIPKSCNKQQQIYTKNGTCNRIPCL